MLASIAHDHVARSAVICRRSLPALCTPTHVDQTIVFNKQLARLAKFAQPVLLAGSILIDGCAVPGHPYFGLAPDAVAHVTAGRRIRSLLTVENFESFNRHVREAQREDEIVVYANGFPSAATVALLNTLVSACSLEEVRHWGDIDGGGVRIGVFLESVVPCSFRPHLMSEELARSHGERITPLAGLEPPASSSFSSLARFLCSSEARSLEQETLDPVPLSRSLAKNCNPDMQQVRTNLHSSN